MVKVCESKTINFLHIRYNLWFWRRTYYYRLFLFWLNLKYSKIFIKEPELRKVASFIHVIRFRTQTFCINQCVDSFITYNKKYNFVLCYNTKLDNSAQQNSRKSNFYSESTKLCAITIVFVILNIHFVRNWIILFERTD